MGEIIAGHEQNYAVPTTLEQELLEELIQLLPKRNHTNPSHSVVGNDLIQNGIRGAGTELGNGSEAQRCQKLRELGKFTGLTL